MRRLMRAASMRTRTGVCTGLPSLASSPCTPRAHLLVPRLAWPMSCTPAEAKAAQTLQIGPLTDLLSVHHRPVTTPCSLPEPLRVRPRGSWMACKVAAHQSETAGVAQDVQDACQCFGRNACPRCACLIPLLRSLINPSSFGIMCLCKPQMGERGPWLSECRRGNQSGTGGQPAPSVLPAARIRASCAPAELKLPSLKGLG